MRIVIFNGGYLTSTPSGGDRHLLDIGRIWAVEHRVRFVVPDTVVHLVPTGAERDAYPSWMPCAALSIVLCYFRRTIAALRKAVRCDADVVLASSGPFDLLPAIMNRHRFRSIVATYVFHIIPPRQARGLTKKLQFALSRLGQRIAMFMIRRADVVFVDNSTLTKALEVRGVPANRIFSQRPAVNVDAVRHARPIPRYQVLFIGRIVPSKGVRDLIEALRGIDVTAGIIGEGEERAGLTRLVREWGLQDRVHLLGSLETTEMYGLLKGCELFVTPSYEEGYGIAIAEAIVAGRPVLAYELDHYAEVFCGSLITVPRGDVAALARRMADFFGGRIDRAAVVGKYASVHILGPKEAANMELDILRRVLNERNE